MASQNDSSEFAEFYVPEDLEDQYEVTGIYHGYKAVMCPKPQCRKYHIRANINSAQAIAGIVLPHLRRHKIHHKIVLNKYWLIEQTAGSCRDQAGKFITIYLDATAHKVNAVVGGLYKAFQQAEGIKPCTIWPKRRRGDTYVGFEEPVYRNRQGVFIWGGFISNPEE